MNTLFSIFVLIVYGVVASFLIPFVLNVAGLPGAFMAGSPGKRSKRQFVFGSIASAIGQSYIYLAYVTFIVSWTKLAAARNDVIGFILWPFSFLVVIGPIWMNLIRARLEAEELNHGNAQTEALHLTFLIVLVGFFMFPFVPKLIAIAWCWVPYTGLTPENCTIVN